jgi:hypothetical protein
MCYLHDKMSVKEGPQNLSSWSGHVIEDLHGKRLGVVHGSAEKNGQTVLLARFQKEKRDRKISISYRSDGEYINPRDKRARYILVSS